MSIASINIHITLELVLLLLLPVSRLGNCSLESLFGQNDTVYKWRRLGLNSGSAPEPKTQPHAAY